MPRVVPPESRKAKLALLSLLYFVQGLPFGFQAIALPVYLRSHGVSLASIGFLGALATPWMLKVLWAPLVDRYGSARFGRRKSWIVPMQLGLAATCGAAAWAPPETSLAVLFGLVLLMNLFAATMDIAVDALAIDILRPGELGLGNTTQVVGYKAGMLTVGGLLVWASGDIGWGGLFAAMAALVAAVMIVTLFSREPADASGASRVESFQEILATARATLRGRGAVMLLVFIGTYKIGEAMADQMFKPFLVDKGFSASDIGLWIGTYGMAFSIAGSIAGGALATRLPVLRALGLAAAARVLPLAAEGALTLGTPTAAQVIGVTCAEHFFGGALTTAMFAFMMARVDRRIGATHYTLFATVEVLGKSPGAWASGLLAQAYGYPPVFAIATLISVAFLGLLPAVRRGEAPLRAGG